MNRKTREVGIYKFPSCFLSSRVGLGGFEFFIT